MLVYVEVPMLLLPTMMALVAKGTCPTSTYPPKTLPTIPEEGSEVWTGFNSNPPLTNTQHSTFYHVQNCIADPMHTANLHSNHHD